MQINLTTPALLFPAITLLLLAYTNRFLTIATLIRTLHSNYKANQDATIPGQIKNLRKRVHLIKQMQAVGVASLFLCVLCMFVLFAGWIILGKYIFCISLMLLLWSLGLSLKEISISVEALELHLSDIEHPGENK